MPRRQSGETELSLTKRESSPLRSTAEVVGGSAQRNANARSALKMEKITVQLPHVGKSCKFLHTKGFFGIEKEPAAQVALEGGTGVNFLGRKIEGAAVNCLGAVNCKTAGWWSAGHHILSWSVILICFVHRKMVSLKHHLNEDRLKMMLFL